MNAPTKSQYQWGGRNPIEKPDALKPGIYAGVLDSIDLITVDVWEKGIKTNQQEEKFDFKFKLDCGVTLHKKVRPKMSIKSGCLELVSSMLPSGVPQEILQAGDNDKYLELMLSLVGKRFSIKTSLSPDGRWSQLDSVTPIVAQTGQVSIEDDDVPM